MIAVKKCDKGNAAMAQIDVRASKGVQGATTIPSAIGRPINAHAPCWGGNHCCFRTFCCGEGLATVETFALAGMTSEAQSPSVRSAHFVCDGDTILCSCC